MLINPLISWSKFILFLNKVVRTSYKCRKKIFWLEFTLILDKFCIKGEPLAEIVLYIEQLSKDYE